MSGGRKANPGWCRVDADIMRNGKVMRLLRMRDGYRAFAVYIESITWATANLTDGRIPDWWEPASVRGSWAGPLRALLEAGLWVEVDDGARQGLPGDESPPLADTAWIIHGFHEYGVGSEEWAEKGRRRSEKARVAAEARWGKQRLRAVER